MSSGAIDAELRQRFRAARRTRVGDTPLRRPALHADERSLRSHFASGVGQAQRPLENPHLEPRVSTAERARAVPASVLLAVVLHAAEPTLLLTRRSEQISHPGHWVFPGGRAEPADASPLDTALREAQEEIGLDPARVEVLGRLGDYVSHSGFRIAPTVALVRPPLALRPQPEEVSAIAELPLRLLLDSASYFLYRFPKRQERAHFALDSEDGELTLTGITVAICIGLYTQLLETHSPR